MKSVVFRKDRAVAYRYNVEKSLWILMEDSVSNVVTVYHSSFNSARIPFL